MNNLLSLKFLPKRLPNNNSFSVSRHFCRTSSSHSSSSSSKIITPHKSTNTHSHFLSPLQQWRSSSNSGLLSLLSNPAIPKYSASSSAAHFKAPIKAFLGSPLRFLTTRCSKVNKTPPPPSSTAEGSHGWLDRVFSGLSVDFTLNYFILLNAAVFIMWKVLPQDFMYKHFTLSPDSFDDGHGHTLLTYSFSHSDAMSFATNMVGLYIFGSSFGRMLGPVTGSLSLLALYPLGALGGALFYKDGIQEYRKKQESSSLDPLLKQENSSMDPLMGATGVVLTFLLHDMIQVPGRIIFPPFSVPIGMLWVAYLVGNDFMLSLKKQENSSMERLMIVTSGAIGAILFLETIQVRRRIIFRIPTFSVPIGMLWVAYLAGTDFMLSLKGDSPANVAQVKGAAFFSFIHAGLSWIRTLVA